MSSAAVSLLKTPLVIAKHPKKTPKPKKPGLPLSQLLVKIIATSKGRGGVSLPALKKALVDRGYDVAKNKARIILSVRRLVTNKTLVHTRGSGASGSFRLNKTPPTPRKKKVVKKKKAAKKPVAKKPRTRSTVGAPPAAKPSPKKRKAKSLKKAKKPAGAKKPKLPKRSKRRSGRVAAGKK